MACDVTTSISKDEERGEKTSDNFHSWQHLITHRRRNELLLRELANEVSRDKTFGHGPVKRNIAYAEFLFLKKT